MIRCLEDYSPKLILQSLLVLTLLLFASTAFSDDFYDMDSVRTIELFFDEANWDQILDDYYAAGNGERLVGTAIIDGVVFDSVGVRYKGNSSYEPNRIKCPFNIKLDHIIEDQEVDGYGTLKLSNGFMDPSFVREVIGYEIARKYSHAGLANFANVYVNDNLMGLYTNVQSVDKSFLADHFHNNDNTFIKGDFSGRPGFDGGARLVYLGPDTADYYDHYEMKSDYGWEDLVHLCDTLNNHTEYVEDILNVDAVLWHLAYHNVLVGLDSPLTMPHNFYLYQNSDRRFEIIFWDLNMTFGTFAMGGGPGQPRPSFVDLQHLSPLLNIDNAQLPLVSLILQNPDYQEQYLAHMKTILEENFENGWYEERCQELQELIDEHVAADPNKLFSYENFLISFDDPVANGQDNIIGITQLMEERTTWLGNHALFQSVSPEIVSVTPEVENPAPYSELVFQTEVSSATDVFIMYREISGTRFIPVEMFDDGAHEDGGAGDGLYGTTISLNSSNIDYYVLALNENATTLLPARAEFEFYSIEVVGDLVINEFLASNESIAADQDGEFDDWVELYNRSDSTIDLSGFYLSDDAAELDKWAFPDTSIAPYEYLIIWTDNDEEQEGLHTSFKLSASGEVILLVNGEGSIVDETIFGEQSTDISMGRYPNGDGPFVQMTPTIGEQNLEGVSGLEESEDLVPSETYLRSNYPNPFNPSTTIRYSLAETSPVEISIYNILGERVATLLKNQQNAGSYEVLWQGINDRGQTVSSGVYLCVLKAGSVTQSRKMILMK